MPGDAGISLGVPLGLVPFGVSPLGDAFFFGTGLATGFLGAAFLGTGLAVGLAAGFAAFLSTFSESVWALTLTGSGRRLCSVF